MRKNMKMFVIMLAIILAVIGCTNNNDDINTNKSNTEEFDVIVSLTKDHGATILEEKTITTERDNNLMGIMEENFEIKEENGFIQSINGLATDLDAETGWIYYVNNEMAIVGANDLELSEGDHVRFDYQVWE